MNLKTKNIKDLSAEEHRAVMERSMEDISSIYEDTRKIVQDIRENGDDVALKHYKKH